MCIKICRCFWLIFRRDCDDCATLNTTPWSNPYVDVCWNFIHNVEGISVMECINYMEENPNATGQDIIEHYKILYKLNYQKMH